MSDKQEFITIVGNLAKNEYLSRGPQKAILPSVCIAQAALESGWNLGAKTLFGIKGKGFTATTSEYYNGVKTIIQDSFRAYPDVASAVVGYYDFIAGTARYAHCLGNSDYKQVVYNLQHTLDGLSYATDPNYESKIVSIIESNNLTEWDGVASATPAPTPAPAPAPVSTDVYTVKAGDTLSAIAKKFGTTVSALANTNGIANPDLVHVGQQIKVSGVSEPQTYVIKSGDTLSGIAKKFGTTVGELQRKNGISNANKIYAGTTIRV